jgi:hypothetical protein
MVDPVAYQLIVTRGGAGPDPGSSRQMRGNSAIQGSTAKNAKEIRALAIDLDLAEIWLGQGLVNAPSCQGFHHFDRLFALPS